MSLDLVHYADLLGQIKLRIRQGQSRAVLSANAEMIITYWDVGRILHERQHQEGWGRAVIPRLTRDLRNELPEIKGFSERNIGRMVAFYRTYSGDLLILPQPVAKLVGDNKVPQSVEQMDTSAILQQLVAKIPWGHNILLMEKVKDLTARLWYMQQIVQHGYVRDTLLSMIKNDSYERHGKAINNFEVHLPPAQSGLVLEALKDPYIFDFLTLEEPFRERELGFVIWKNFCLNWARDLLLWGVSIASQSAKRITISICSFTILSFAALWLLN